MDMNEQKDNKKTGGAIGAVVCFAIYKIALVPMFFPVAQPGFNWLEVLGAAIAGAIGGVVGHFIGEKLG